MLGRVLTALTVAAAITSAASAQDVKRPQIDFGRYHALVIGNNDYPHLPKLATVINGTGPIPPCLGYLWSPGRPCAHAQLYAGV